MQKLQENSNLKNPFTILTIVRKINEMIDTMDWNIVIEPIANQQIEENRVKMKELEDRMNELVEQTNNKLSIFSDKLDSLRNRIENKIIKWNDTINKMKNNIQDVEDAMEEKKVEEEKAEKEKNILIQLNDNSWKKKTDLELFEDIYKLKWTNSFTQERLTNISLMKPVQIKLLLARLMGKKLIEKIEGKQWDTRYKCNW